MCVWKPLSPETAVATHLNKTHTTPAKAAELYCSVLLCTALYCAVLLYCSVLRCTALYCVALADAVCLQYNAVHTALYCRSILPLELYCTVLRSRVHGRPYCAPKYNGVCTVLWPTL